MKRETVTVCLFALVVFCTCIVSRNVHAQLVELDFINGSNDGLITYDAVTDLDWLDPVYTLGEFISEVDAMMLDGQELSGFRYATSPEFDNVLARYAISSSYSAGNYDNARILLDLLGGTNGPDWMTGFADGLPGGIGPLRGGSLHIRDNGGVLEGRGYSWRTGAEDFTDGSNAMYGHLLVRNHVVPEPSTFALFAIAMLGMSRRRRRR